MPNMEFDQFDNNTCPWILTWCCMPTHEEMSLCRDGMEAYLKVQVNGTDWLVCPLCETITTDSISSSC